MLKMPEKPEKAWKAKIIKRVDFFIIEWLYFLLICLKRIFVILNFSFNLISIFFLLSSVYFYLIINYFQIVFLDFYNLHVRRRRILLQDQSDRYDVLQYEFHQYFFHPVEYLRVYNFYLLLFYTKT